MENYIYVNGKQISLSDEQVKQIISAYEGDCKKVKLEAIPAGGTFKVDGMEFVVLEQNGETTAVITKKILKNMAFGDTNNFNGSAVDNYCKEFSEEIFEKIGAENIVVHTVDLISDDGLKDYGTVKRMVSILTADQYRKYVDVLDQHKLGEYWWLATPHRTARHENDNWVKCVSPSGSVNRGNCSSVSRGVRPFCILKSSIFVSVERRESYDENKPLFPGVKPGETFKIGEMEFIRFADTPAGTPVILKDIAFRSRFGDNNDFRSSDILKRLQEELLPKIVETVGDENVLEFETDLTTLDGLKTYGAMLSRISLPTLDFYRANVEIFDRCNPKKYWWLATAESASPHFSTYWILCVSPSGSVNDAAYYIIGGIGVRPFLIFKSSIFESCEE